MTLSAALSAVAIALSVSACKTPPTIHSSAADEASDPQVVTRTGESPNGTRMNPVASGDRTYYLEREVDDLSKKSKEALPKCQAFAQALDALQSHSFSEDPALLFQDHSRAMQALALLEKAPGPVPAGRKAWKLVAENPGSLPSTARFASALNSTLAHCAPLQVAKALEGLHKGRKRLKLTLAENRRVKSVTSRFLRETARFPADPALMSAGSSLMAALARSGGTAIGPKEVEKLERDAQELARRLPTLSEVIPDGTAPEEAAKRLPELLPEELESAEAFRQRLESAVSRML